MTRIKICGITREEDLELALELEVDALGFNFVPGTPRALEPEPARRLCEAARARAWCVGVFRNAPLERVRDVAVQVGLDAVQLHGDESPEYAGAVGWPVLKALRGDPEGLRRADAYPEAALLVDHPSGGGRGLAWDFGLAGSLVAQGREVWLAGGLGPDNVRAAIRAVWPYGVDVASGVESRPGIKSPEALRRFVAAVRAEVRDG